MIEIDYERQHGHRAADPVAMNAYWLELFSSKYFPLSLVDHWPYNIEVIPE